MSGSVNGFKTSARTIKIMPGHRTERIHLCIKYWFHRPRQNVNAYHSSRRSFATPTLFLISCLPVLLRFSSINGTLPCLDNPFFWSFLLAAFTVTFVNPPSPCFDCVGLLPLLSVQSVRAFVLVSVWQRCQIYPALYLYYSLSIHGFLEINATIFDHTHCF